MAAALTNVSVALLIAPGVSGEHYSEFRDLSSLEESKKEI